MENFEKLGLFYLGSVLDQSRKPSPEPLLYDARDLTTHAVCVGMTGSGKTGLGIALLEEAAIDHIPAIIIDPKGDMGNLLLKFPALQPADFLPWIDPNEASRAGLSRDDYAAKISQRWRDGLKASGQTPERITTLAEAAETVIYTPGNRAGLPLNVLKSFVPPSGELETDPDALNDRIASLVSGLLSLLGLEADPLQSREHILLSQIFADAWQKGLTLELSDLIRSIQSPSFQKVGVFDLDSFFPLKDRASLAMRVNNLLASPAFQGWVEGEPLEIERLLYGPQGKPRHSILAIAHLSDAERMFFVTLLLNEIVAWIRRQAGTNSLRAILYMDEIFGYFPPTANPPSKRPMLTLLKQARAYGLGCMLATQNPVDLDYKGLANAGTWFVGRLQTERDKNRLLDGLEGAGAAASRSFDRAEFDRLLASLGQRVFLMNNVHEDGPVLFQTRHTLSYLAGPLTLAQIRGLRGTETEVLTSSTAERAGSKATEPRDPMPAASGVSEKEPLLPAGVKRVFLVARQPLSSDGTIYHGTLLGSVKIHYVQEKFRVDLWQTVTLLADIPALDQPVAWDAAEQVLDRELPVEAGPRPGARFAALPPAAGRAANYPDWSAQLHDFIHQNQVLAIFEAPDLRLTSQPGETETQFRVRLGQSSREKRDEAVENLRKRYRAKFDLIEQRLRTARARVDRESSEFQSRTFSTAVSVGAAILGAFMGRKRLSSTNVSRAASAVRSAGSAVRERSDVGRAEETVGDLERKLEDLNAELQAEIDQVEAGLSPNSIRLNPITVRPRKSDLSTAPLIVAWVPG